MEILKAENLSFYYPSCSHPALLNVDFSVDEGDFVVLIGKSGCGKSTLLRLMKKELSPNGNLSGNITYFNKDIQTLSSSVSASEIGFVGQNPNLQIVTDKVWHELAFGLENLGIKPNEIKRRVGETASYFGLSDIYNKPCCELSGGEKQLVCLASIMVMRPKILILDEPTSRLDPIGANHFIETLRKINKDFGITVIIAEHRIDALLEFSDKVLMLSDGRLVVNSSPKKAIADIGKTEMKSALPIFAKLFCNELENDAPLCANDARKILKNRYKSCDFTPKMSKNDGKNTAALSLKGVYFAYSKSENDIIFDCSLTVNEGEILTVVGENGCGKSTLIKLICGILPTIKGKIELFGKSIKKYDSASLHGKTVSYLPQNPLNVFVEDTVKLDFENYLKNLDYKKQDIDEIISKNANEFEIEDLLDKNPMDLSGGEQQKCAFAKIMLCCPKILLLDEPTKGLDAIYKKHLCDKIKSIGKSGVAVIIVTHDLDFAADVSDETALLFNSQIVSKEKTDKFFLSNEYFTTEAIKLSRGIFDGCVNENDIKCALTQAKEKSDE